MNYKRHTFEELVAENRRLRKQNRKLSKQVKSMVINFNKTANKLFNKKKVYADSLLMPTQEQIFGYESGIEEAVHDLKNATFACLN